MVGRPPPLLIPVETPVHHATGLEERVGIGLVLKMEGASPTGTHKFRAAQAAFREAIRMQAPGVVAASCGSYAVALAWIAERLGMHAQLMLPEYSDALIRDSDLVRVFRRAPTYEDAVSDARAEARRSGFLDVTPHDKVRASIRRAYRDVWMELSAELRRNTDAVVVPVGNGTTLCGIYEAVALDRTVDLPRIYAAGVGGNAIFGELESKRDLAFEALYGVQPLDEAGVRDALAATGGAAVKCHPEAILDARIELQGTEGIDCYLPSAVAVAAALWLAEKGRLSARRKAVVVLTSGNERA